MEIEKILTEVKNRNPYLDEFATIVWNNCLEEIRIVVNEKDNILKKDV